MVRTKDELLASIKDRFKDDTSDETISFIEDVSDTINDLETKALDETDWKSKYEENDKQWREKYRDRFFNSEGDDPKQLDEEPPKPMNFEDLFTVKK